MGAPLGHANGKPQGGQALAACSLHCGGDGERLEPVLQAREYWSNVPLAFKLLQACRRMVSGHY